MPYWNTGEQDGSDGLNYSQPSNDLQDGPASILNYFAKTSAAKAANETPAPQASLTAAPTSSTARIQDGIQDAPCATGSTIEGPIVVSTEPSVGEPSSCPASSPLDTTAKAPSDPATAPNPGQCRHCHGGVSNYLLVLPL